MATLRAAVNTGALRLAAMPELAANATRDAELLLFTAAGISRTELLAHPEREVAEESLARYEASLSRRLQNEPIQYILGEQEFYGLSLRVTPAVLIPRPETEHLVEAVLSRLTGAVRVLDVGTGSGAIAIALAKELPEAKVTAVDISPAALEVASSNALNLGLADRIHFRQSDLLESVSGERYDAIVSNPPYVPIGDRTAMHPQVREYEPELALYGGATGMDIYARLIPQAHAALRPHGLLAMEFGFGQREAISKLLTEWAEVSFADDLQGIPRVALARRD